MSPVEPDVKESINNVGVLSSIIMGNIRQFGMDHPEVGMTVGDVQAALARCYDELVRRAIGVRRSEVAHRC